MLTAETASKKLLHWDPCAPDPPDDDQEDEDNQQPIIHLGGNDDDDIKNEVKEENKEMENHNENEVEEENEAAFCDEYRPDPNIGIWTHHAHLKWKLVPEKVRGIEISAYSHGYDVSSDTAHHHAQAEEELERLHEPRVVQFGYNEESEDDDQDNFPLQPVDCNHKAADASQ